MGSLSTTNEPPSNIIITLRVCLCVSVCVRERERELVRLCVFGKMHGSKKNEEQCVCVCGTYSRKVAHAILTVIKGT